MHASQITNLYSATQMNPDKKLLETHRYRAVQVTLLLQKFPIIVDEKIINKEIKVIHCKVHQYNKRKNW